MTHCLESKAAPHLCWRERLIIHSEYWDIKGMQCSQYKILPTGLCAEICCSRGKKGLSGRIRTLSGLILEQIGTFYRYLHQNAESKHLKGHLRPRVSDVTFLLKGHLGPRVSDITFLLRGHWGPRVSDVTFLLKGHWGPRVSDVTFLLKGHWGPASVTSRF